MPRLQDKYNQEIAPALMKKFGYKSVMQIPKLEKIVVNVGCGDCKDNQKMIENVQKEISQITGQHAVITKARKSVANFKLREGMNVGVKV
ncbi:MAG: 50S ribosomal protein L5, partial [Oscillospiraceae bacterium]|nr:50S ribosomal protein L5 [Oscillospiraceae bacterium]